MIPTGRHPVLLIPGWSDRARHLAPLRRRFVQAGWPRESTIAVGFRDRFGSNVDHAHEIARAIDEVLEKTGGDRVDLVAHSMGGIAARLLVAGAEGSTVRRVAFLATPHRGTFSAYLAWGIGAEEVRPGSVLLRELSKKARVPSIALRVPFDSRVIPGSSARLAGARNHVVLAGHRSILRHKGAFELVRGFFECEHDDR